MAISFVSSYQQLVDEELPPAARSHIPAALDRAYRAVGALMSDTTFLKTDAGRGAYGYLLPYAVEHFLVQLIESGLWRFDYEWTDYARPTGKYLQIRTKRSVLTASQLQDAGSFPRRAGFRDNHRLNNDPAQLVLFEDPRGQPGEIRQDDRFHFILTHGYHGLRFAHVCIPHSEDEIWLYRSPNLLDLPHTIDTPAVPPVEGIPHQQSVELKEELLDALKDRRDRDR